MNRHRNPPGADPRDAQRRARFVAAYDGSSDPVDALFWLDHPDAEGPSGAPSPESGLDELRAALYRRDADESAVAAYRVREQVVAQDRAAALRALELARPGTAVRGVSSAGWWWPALLRRRPHAAPAVVGALLALAFTATTVGVPPSSDPVPLRFRGPASTAAQQEAAISALFTTEFAATSGPTRSVVVVPPAALSTDAGPVVGRTFRVIGTVDVRLPVLAPRSRSARLTVLVVCSGPGGYEWVVRGSATTPSASAPVRTRGCERSATSATVDIDGSDGALILRFTGPPATSTFVALAVTRPG